MEALGELWRRLLFLLRRRQFDRELEEEIQCHLAMAVQQNQDAPMSAEDARYAALRKFGNPVSLGERSREAWGWRWLEDLLRDGRYALRSLRRGPAFAAVAVLTIALGVGSNTAMFSVLYGTCLAPLPFAEPDRLVEVSMMQTTGRKFEAGTSSPNLSDWTSAASSFEGLAPHRLQYFVSLTGYGAAEEIQAWRLSAQAFSLLRVPPILGRGFVPDEDTPAGPRSTLLSYQLWQSRFNGDAHVLGKRVSIDGEAFTIAGVMPDRFEFPPMFGSWKPVMWLSLNLPPEMATERGTHGLHILGRLKRGVSIEKAQAEMEGISSRLAKAYPKENGEWPTAKVVALGDASHVEDFRSTLWLLSAAAGLVLLIACANVASLLIARGISREREFAVRRALGVSTGRLVRQVLTESCVLAGLGCVLGVLFAFWSLPALKSMLEGRPRVEDIGLQPVVLAFAAGVSLLTGVLFGLPPALRAGWGGIAGVQSGRTGPPRQRLRTVLVGLEIALGVVLLSAAGLLIESFWRATRVDLGFRPDQILTMRFNLPQRRYGTALRVEAFREELLRQVSALPGVAFAGTNSAPPMGVVQQQTDFEIERKPQTGGEEQNVSFANVSPDYLHAMGTPLLRGRNFAPTDRSGAPPVVIVSQSVARRFFSGEEILGQRIRLGRLDSPEWFTVVGVAGDVREYRPEKPPNSTIYALSGQLPAASQRGRAARTIVLVVRATGDPSGLIGAVRAAAAGIDPDQPAGDVLTLRQIVEKKLAGRRLNTLLIGLFAALAVILAIVGVFGLVSYSVSCRVKEISIRMALGARRSAMLAMILRDTLAFGVPGVVVGIAASFGTSRLLAAMLYGVEPAAPHVLFAAAAFLATAMVVASLSAARRAVGLDPILALRQD